MDLAHRVPHDPGTHFGHGSLHGDQWHGLHHLWRGLQQVYVPTGLVTNAFYPFKTLSKASNHKATFFGAFSKNSRLKNLPTKNTSGYFWHRNSMYISRWLSIYFSHVFVRKTSRLKKLPKILSALIALRRECIILNWSDQTWLPPVWRYSHHSGRHDKWTHTYELGK